MKRILNFDGFINESNEYRSKSKKYLLDNFNEVPDNSQLYDAKESDFENLPWYVSIKKAFPDHQILAEESGALEQSSDYKWIIDPIDGTVNFAQGIPLNCVSIAIEFQGSIILGAVYNPHLNEFFFAEKGKGATLNDKPIQVSKKTSTLKSCLVTGFPYTYINEPNGPIEVFERFVRKGVPVRRLGSAAIDLCWVACGRFDGFFEQKLEPWDSAAGYLIVEEAGGKVTDFKGVAFSVYQHKLIATNGLIHTEMVEVINGRKEL